MAIPKKPETTKLNQGIAKWEIMTKLRSYDKDVRIKKEDFKKIILQIFNTKYDNREEHQKYFFEIYKIALSFLKKKKWFSIDEGEIVFKKINLNNFGTINTKLIDWDTEQTISTISNFVDSRKHFLPSFQRGTAWLSQKDYKELALSIFKSVPLGLMYFWKIDKQQVDDIKHFYFKKNVKSNESSFGFEEVKISKVNNESLSIIDGQQRITGINLIVGGEFNGKTLYYNDNDTKVGIKKFEFRNNKDSEWTEVPLIFTRLESIFKKCDNADKTDKIRRQHLIEKLSNELFIKVQSLWMFYNGFFKSKLIAICKLPEGKFEHVLQIFLRTNNFGKKLKPADIMKSMLVGNDSTIKKRINVTLQIFQKYKEDFKEATVLKLLSVYFTGSPKINHDSFFKLNEEKSSINADLDVKKDISWKILNNAIKTLFKILDGDSFSVSWISSDNSLIPIIVWLTNKHKGKMVNDQKSIRNIMRYMLWAQTSKYFGSSTDSKLIKLIKLNKKIEYDKTFSNWKEIAKDEEGSLSNIVQRLRRYSYDNPYEKKIIKTILEYSNNTTIKANDITIEHLIPQSKEGSHWFSNLALLPKGMNSSIGNYELREKIKSIKEQFQVETKEVLDFLHLTEDEVNKGKIDEDARILKIAKGFYTNSIYE